MPPARAIKEEKMNVKEEDGGGEAAGAAVTAGVEESKEEEVAGGFQQLGPGFKEYPLVRRPRATKEAAVLAFDTGYNINLGQLEQPVQLSREQDEGDMASVMAPGQGVGSTFGDEAKAAARARRSARWRAREGPRPSPNVHLEDARERHFIGTDQGRDEDYKYFYVSITEDDAMQVAPVNRWFRMTQARNITTLSLDEAEAEMQKRTTVHAIQNRIASRAEQEAASRELILGSRRTGPTFADTEDGMGEREDIMGSAVRARARAAALAVEAADEAAADELDIDNAIGGDFEVMSSDEEIGATGDVAATTRFGEENEAAELAMHGEVVLSSEEGEGPSDSETEKSEEDEEEKEEEEASAEAAAAAGSPDATSTARAEIAEGVSVGDKKSVTASEIDPIAKNQVRYVSQKEKDEIANRKRKRAEETLSRSGKRMRQTKGLTDKEAGKVEMLVKKYLGREAMTTKSVLKKILKGLNKDAKTGDAKERNRRYTLYTAEVLDLFAESKRSQRNPEEKLWHLLDKYKQNK